MTKRKANVPPLTAEEEARIQAQIANDPDAPELTDEQAATARPFAEAFPDLHASWKRRPGRPKAEVTKVPVKLRLDPDVVEGYRATGPGWQTRMNDVLRQGLPEQEVPAMVEPARLLKVSTYVVGRSTASAEYVKRRAQVQRTKPGSRKKPQAERA